MTTRARLETVVICAAFVLYVVFALKLLLFSRPLGTERSFNLIPFASISHYLFSGSSGVRRFAFGNIAGNVLLFIPLGASLSALTKSMSALTKSMSALTKSMSALTKSTGARTMLFVASASVAVEIVQGVFALGASDIDDVILNCLGGFIGIQLFLLLRVILRNLGRVRTVVAVLSVVALPVLCYLLFVIRLRM
ncbi:VanZ family protein [Raineyella sp. LH-20]|uniref:VanZ family protein n=1 Tax=Raineyella sp. LH-20 TaxID=3081204 RepID=UPI002952B9CA|nr:VanZ family protein [Raineyella sp. LH-20]WOP19185.1 VanZ family protein [Raineyella sp. LH-20]